MRHVLVALILTGCPAHTLAPTRPSADTQGPRIEPIATAAPTVAATAADPPPARASCRICGDECPTMTTAACREGLDKLCHSLADPIAADDAARFVAFDPTMNNGPLASSSGESVRAAVKEQGPRQLLGLDRHAELRAHVLRDCRACRRPYVTLMLSTGAQSIRVWIDTASDTPSNVQLSLEPPSSWNRPTALVPEKQGQCPEPFRYPFRYLGCGEEDRRDLMASVWLEGTGDVPVVTDPNLAKARCVAVDAHLGLNDALFCCREP